MIEHRLRTTVETIVERWKQHWKVALLSIKYFVKMNLTKSASVISVKPQNYIFKKPDK